MKSTIGLFVAAMIVIGANSGGPLRAEDAIPNAVPPPTPPGAVPPVAPSFPQPPNEVPSTIAPSATSPPLNSPYEETPPETRAAGIGIFKLKHADAATLAQQISQIYGHNTAVADARSNSVIVHGGLMPIAENLIKALDQPAEKPATISPPASPWVGEPRTSSSDPASVRDISATIDGVVTGVLVKHGDDVKTGATLVEMKSPELDASISDLQTKLKESELRLQSVEKLRQKKLITEAEVLIPKNTTEGLRTQLALLNEKKSNLTVVSPIDGKVITQNVNEQLIGRPVQRGQVLLQLALPTASQMQVGGLRSPFSLDFTQSKLREDKLRQLVAHYKKILADIKNGQRTEQDITPTKAEIHTSVLEEVTAKHASQVEQLGQMRAKVDRIEQTLVEQEKNRDAIVARRVEELLSNSGNDAGDDQTAPPANNGRNRFESGGISLQPKAKAQRPKKRGPSLDVSISGKAQQVVGDKAELVVTVSNGGDVELSDLTVTAIYDSEILSPQFATVGYQNQTAAQEGRLIWKVGKLEPGLEIYRKIQIDCLKAADKARFQVEVTAKGLQPSTKDLTFIIVEKRAGTPQVEPPPAVR